MPGTPQTPTDPEEERWEENHRWEEDEDAFYRISKVSQVVARLARAIYETEWWQAPPSSTTWDPQVNWGSWGPGGCSAASRLFLSFLSFFLLYIACTLLVLLEKLWSVRWLEGVRTGVHHVHDKQINLIRGRCHWRVPTDLKPQNISEPRHSIKHSMYFFSSFFFNKMPAWILFNHPKCRGNAIHGVFGEEESQSTRQVVRSQPCPPTSRRWGWKVDERRRIHMT